MPFRVRTSSKRSALLTFNPSALASFTHESPLGSICPQLNFSSLVGNKARELNLDLGIPEPFPQDSNYPPFSYDLDLIGDLSKSSALPAELRAAAIQTVQERYPPSEWLHVYTDGSADGAVKNGGAGTYSAIFEISEPVGLRASNFDGEIVAVQLAVREVERRRLPYSRLAPCGPQMITGHDYLQKHLYRIGAVDSPTCPLCSLEEMDARHIMECPALEEIGGIEPGEVACEKYWAARRLMNETSRI
ncbi:hypothetical protein GE061_013317 [Apolygus lucorum]|uniref:RNase H type-1 domain-containing protein n=1 Tax=Apolygus lucorum TaxID=248454 RepID=A0A8S9XNM6_APOLU|nr:hypothetical protein GE061_013317 [Apolygus lucorum]